MTPVWLLLVLMGVLAWVFLPLYPCLRCGVQREELTSWLSEPYARKYQDEHPAEVAEVKAQLGRMDATCGCVHGKINLVERNRTGWFFKSQR